MRASLKTKQAPAQSMQFGQTVPVPIDSVNRIGVTGPYGGHGDTEVYPRRPLNTESVRFAVTMSGIKRKKTTLHVTKQQYLKRYS